MKSKVALSKLQDYYVLAIKAPLGVFRKPFYFKETIEQMDYAGSGSFFIVFLVSLFIGMALSLQTSAELAEMGLKMYTGRVVGMSIIKEIGPVAIALSFAGRVGSGMASEIGSMTLGHQVDILRVHGVSPIKKLVTPRVVSAILMLPVLTVIGDAFALFGGYIISVTAANQSGSVYWGQIKQIMDFETIFSGIVKPFIFGYLISTISCYMGLATRGGARGLRKSTTEAVVYSTIMIIVGDFMVTKILIMALGIPI